MNTQSKIADFGHDFQSDIDAIGRSTQLPVLLETVLLATGMGFAAVARVTETRWVTCRALDLISFGLRPGDELEVESTLCHEVRLSDKEIVIDDVNDDPVYINHHTPAKYGFRSYISIPIKRQDGSFFGTLCAIDPEPKNLKDERVLKMFRLFAQLIGDGLETDEKLRESEVAIERERQLAEVQERFIAILAHDLRNPVSVLEAGFRMVGRQEVSPRVEEITRQMKGSLTRMARLIENLLHQARSRQDEGIILNRDEDLELEPVLRELVDELNAVYPEQKIHAAIDLPCPVNCDGLRIAQLLSNLLGNAVNHGTPGEPILLDAYIAGDDLVVSVANHGKPIPEDQKEYLFQPFQQGEQNANRKGLGLGLYIASEIAKAHGGRLDISSDDALTKFTLTMPK